MKRTLKFDEFIKLMLFERGVRTQNNQAIARLTWHTKKFNCAPFAVTQMKFIATGVRLGGCWSDTASDLQTLEQIKSHFLPRTL